MKVIRFLVCAVILCSSVTRAADPQPLSTILDLPREAWCGGPAYYAQFPRAASSGWTNASFFPLAVFFGKPSHAAALKAAGVNTYMGAEHDGSSLSSITSIGMCVLAQTEWTPAEVGDNSLVVGWHAADEPDMTSTLAEQITNVANLRSRNDGRFIQTNYGNGVLGTFWDTTANPLTGHVALQDVTSVDKYAYTSPDVRFEFGRSPYWPLGADGAQCSAVYGWQQDRMEAYMSPVASKPNWVFVETAMPYLTEAGASTIGLEEFEGAVWNAIIHGAAGIAYFQHNNNGLPGYSTYSIIECPAERTAKITAVNAQVTRLAPVLNTQPYQWSFGTGLNTSLRVYDGYAYILAMIAGGTGTGARTFNLPADISAAASVEVVDEGRTLTVTSGTFTDSFAAEHEHHIYRVIVSPTAPAITTQPTNQSVIVGQTATFSVTAAGAAPIYYQWQTNSVNLAGATNASYTTPATILADSGKAFRVLVTNSLGSVTSSVAMLTVLAPDNTPPVVSLTAPGSGATVSNTVTVSATATDNVAVVGVQFKLDGANLGAEDTSNPHSTSWDTSTAANGSHTLTAVARDAAGNATTSTAVNVTVSNVAGVLTVAASSPAAVKGNSTTLTTASFTPPAGSMLYILFASQQAVGSITDNLGAHLTYTLQATYGNSGGDDAMVYLYTAPVTASQAMTVSVTQVPQVTGQYAMLKVLVITGADHDAPVGAKGGGRGASGVVSDTYTSTAAGSLGWLLYADWMQQSIPTAGANQSVYDSYTVVNEDTYAIIRQTNVTLTVGTSVTMNTTSPTTGGRIAHLYFEMRPSVDVLVDGIPSSWLIQYFNSTNAVNGHAQEDWDHDGMNNYGEWKAGTCPTNAASLLRMSGVSGQNGTDLVIQWTSVTGKTYTIQGTTNLLAGFTESVSNGIAATPGTNSCTLPIGQAAWKFYRVMVE